MSQYVISKLGASLLGNLLTGKGTFRAGKDTDRAGQYFQCHLMLYQILKCKSIIKNEPKFNCVYSRNNLPKLKDVAYVIHLDEYESILSH